VNAYLQVACAALDFELGEVWCYRRQDPSSSYSSDDEDIESLSQAMRFVQLYTSPNYDTERSKLLRPKSIPDPRDVEEHRFSPVICDAVRSGKRLVWASTEEGSGLLGRSDLPLRTAVGVPVCSIGFDLCILVLFGTKRSSAHDKVTDLLISIAQAAGGHMSGALPASISSPITTCLDIVPITSSGKRRHGGIDAGSGSSGSAGGEDEKTQVVRTSASLNSATLVAPNSLVPRRIMHKLSAAVPSDVTVRIISANQPDAFQEVVIHGQRRPGVGMDSPSRGAAIGRTPSPFSGSRTFAELFPFGYMDSMLLDTTSPSFPLSMPASFGGREPTPRVAVPADAPPVSVTCGDSLSARETAVPSAAVELVSEDPEAASFGKFYAGRASPSHAAPPLDAVAEDSFIWEHTVGLDDDLVDFGLDSEWDLLEDGSANDLDATLHGGIRMATAAPDEDLDTTLHGGSRATSYGTTGAALPAAPQSVVGSFTHGPPISGSAGSVFSSSSGGSGRLSAEAKPLHLDSRFTTAMSRRQRFEEMMRGFLDMTIFEAADYWVAQPIDRSATAASLAQPTLLKFESSVVKSPALQPWSAYSSETVFTPMVGLVGRIFATGSPIWERSLHRKSQHEYPRAPGAKALGIATAFGVPVGDLGMQRPGVICFYSTASMEYSDLIVGFLQKIVKLLDTCDPQAPCLSAVLHDSLDPRPTSAFGGARRTVPAVAHQQLPASTFFYSSEQQPQQRAAAMSAPAPPRDPSMMLAVGAAGEGYTQEMLRAAAGNSGPRAPLAHTAIKREAPVSSAYSSAVEHLAFPNPSLLAASDLPPAAFNFDLVTATDMDALAFLPETKRTKLLPPRHGAAAAAQSVPMSAAELLPTTLGLPGPVDPGTTLAAPGAKVCRMSDCNQPASKRSPYCAGHMGARQCQHAGCSKCAQGSTKYCIAHGGGRRCTHPGCTRGARDKFFCAAHGGGKRCSLPNCNKSAVGGSSLCTAHGGGRRCQHDGCSKSAQSSTRFCVRHGGGRKCCVEGCEKVARGRTLHCAAHGGGVRCKLEGCNKAAVGRQQLCRVHSGTSVPKRRQSKAAVVATAPSVAPVAPHTAHALQLDIGTLSPPGLGTTPAVVVEGNTAPRAHVSSHLLASASQDGKRGRVASPSSHSRSIVEACFE